MNNNAYQYGEGNEYLSLDYTRCQRPDGSYYGTGGVCRKGSQVDAREKPEKKAKSSNLEKGIDKQFANAIAETYREDGYLEPTVWEKEGFDSDDVALVMAQYESDMSSIAKASYKGMSEDQINESWSDGGPPSGMSTATAKYMKETYGGKWSKQEISKVEDGVMEYIAQGSSNAVVNSPGNFVANYL